MAHAEDETLRDLGVVESRGDEAQHPRPPRRQALRRRAALDPLPVGAQCATVRSIVGRSPRSLGRLRPESRVDEARVLARTGADKRPQGGTRRRRAPPLGGPSDRAADSLPAVLGRHPGHVDEARGHHLAMPSSSKSRQRSNSAAVPPPGVCAGKRHAGEPVRAAPDAPAVAQLPEQSSALGVQRVCRPRSSGWSANPARTCSAAAAIPHVADPVAARGPPSRAPRRLSPSSQVDQCALPAAPAFSRRPPRRRAGGWVRAPRGISFLGAPASPLRAAASASPSRAAAVARPSPSSVRQREAIATERGRARQGRRDSARACPRRPRRAPERRATHPPPRRRAARASGDLGGGPRISQKRRAARRAAVRTRRRAARAGAARTGGRRARGSRRAGAPAERPAAKLRLELTASQTYSRACTCAPRPPPRATSSARARLRAPSRASVASSPRPASVLTDRLSVEQATPGGRGTVPGGTTRPPRLLGRSRVQPPAPDRPRAEEPAARRTQGWCQLPRQRAATGACAEAVRRPADEEVERRAQPLEQRLRREQPTRAAADSIASGRTVELLADGGARARSRRSARNPEARRRPRRRTSRTAASSRQTTTQRLHPPRAPGRRARGS